MNKTFYPTSSNASHHKSARQPGRQIGDNQPQASKKTDRQTRVRALIRALGDGMHEREEIIAVALLGAMCGQNSFLYGPPGTAKSLISRRLACAFEAPAYFEYLMNRFSTPEEVFGPISISELKQDRYFRKTDAYLPKADFAFLDEIWKSSPAILNTLLTLINERIFRNGTEIEKTPLKALIAASNETPEPNQGLEALYDRFLIRLLVGPIEGVETFERLLDSAPTEAEIKLKKGVAIRDDEWMAWRNDIHEVKLSPETLRIIGLIRVALTERYDELKVYVSDRRWQRAATLMKAAAFFNDRQETNHSDAVLLQHCLWTDRDNRNAVIEIVEKAILDSGFDSGIDLTDLDRRKDILEKEIEKDLYYTSDVYDSVEIGTHRFFKLNIHLNDPPKTIVATALIPVEKLKSYDKFQPFDNKGNLINGVHCTFDNQGTCKLNYDQSFGHDFNRRYGYKPCPSQFTPDILFHKGDRKQGVNPRLIKDFLQSVAELRAELVKIREASAVRFEGYAETLASPFAPKSKTQLALDGITKQIESMDQRIADCDRLKKLCE